MKLTLSAGLMAIILLAACGGGGEAPSTEPLPSLSAEEIIAQASPRLDELDSFHFKLSEEGGGTPIAMGLKMLTAEGDIIPPDRMNMRIEAEWFGQFVEAKLVTVGTITYMTNPINGKWELLDEDFTAITLFQPDTGIKAVMESVTGLCRLDAEKTGGTLCFHLKGDIDSMVLDAIAVGHAAGGLSVDTDIWIGSQDFLLRKVVFDGRITEEEDEGIVRTLELSRFNEPMEVELPK
ncbi:MAG: LppX_LprAFG lipoprotein [Dehalococcoidia bacterium]